MRRIAVLLISVCLLVAVSVVSAHQTKKTSKTTKSQKGPGILHPDMTPQKGTHEQPADKLGKTSSQPWTQTTYEAAVDGKPLEGKVVKIVGEVIDYSCYLQLGKHGDKHRDCGQKCLRNGQPMGLLTKDGSIYLLMPEEHHPRRDGHTTLRDELINEMANIIEVTGTETKVDNVKALYVVGFVHQ